MIPPSPASSEAISCPVCKACITTQATSSYTVAQAAAHFCPSSRNPDRYQRLVKCITRLWQRESSQIYHCSKCGFGFGYPFVGGDEEFYGILHEQHGYPAWRWDYDYALQNALAEEKAGRIVDIGAGTGAFLLKLGESWETHAIEGSPTTREKLKASGIRVSNDLMELAEKLPGGFQVVTLFQVLEHIAEFPQILQSCQTLLSPGGKIVITVPDAEGMKRQEELTGCADMPPNHINKWTPVSLGIALEKAGFAAGEAVYQPASWSSLRSVLYLRVLANRANPRSIAAQVYRIPIKAIRVPLIALLAVPAFFQLVPHLKELCKSSAFGMVGSKK